MPTKSCCVDGCKNQNVGADSGVIFYKFPEDKILKKKWIEACRKNEALLNKKWEPEPTSVICNVHFVSAQKSPHDWHPDYVPSVFRSLRRVIKKKKGRFFDDSDDDASKEKTKAKTLGVKRLQKPGGLKRAALSTPTRNTPKPKITVPATTGGLRKPLRLTKGRGRPKKLSADEVSERLDSPGRIFSGADYDDYRSSDSESEFIADNKRKLIDGDIPDDAGTPLKGLSVVLERTSDKKIKLTTGEITIKEEPIGDLDYISPTSISLPKSVFKAKRAGRPPKTGKPAGKGVSKTPASRLLCKKCLVLEQKLLKLESSMLASGRGVEKCQRCPVIEHELKKVEEELEDIIESKLSKCQRCSLVEQKCKRVENNLRKAQTELNKIQNKLVNIEISEDTLKKYKNKVKLYTGFPNYDSLLLVFEHLKPHFPNEPTKGISHFQMFILVMMRLKMNLPFWDLTYRFGASPSAIQSLYPQYLSVLDSSLSHVVLWPKTNMQFRLQVLASNLKQSFLVIHDQVTVETLMAVSADNLSDKDKTARVCAAMYHIAQLVSSNHSQQLVKILKSKEDMDKKTLDDDTTQKEEEEGTVNPEDISTKDAAVKGAPLMNGMDDVDDSDIFFEDLTKDVGSGLNSNFSLELECKHLRKEIDSLNQKLSGQFKFYTGLRNFDTFKNLLGYMQTFVSNISTQKLLHFQQLQVVLMRFKLNLEVQDLAYMFSVDIDHIVYLTRVWSDIMVQKLSCYIDWPGGIEDSEGEKKLLGTVKLKYQILWNPHEAPRNRDSGREREKLDIRKLLRVCAAVYNIDDIEVFKDGKKEQKTLPLEGDNDERSNEELEKECQALRSEIYDLRKHVMSNIATCLAEESLQNNDRMVRYYTGFQSYEILKNIFSLIIPTSKPENRKALSPFQQLVALLIRLKLNITSQDLAYRFGMGQSNIHKLLQDWLVLLHSQLAPHITWPDDDEDVEVFTEILRKTYSYLRSNNSLKKFDRRCDAGFFDIATLVCAGLYNVGEVSFLPQSDTEFESFDEDW